MECPHLAQSVRLDANDVETTCTKDLPFVCAAGEPFMVAQGYVGRDSRKNHCDGNGNGIVVVMVRCGVVWCSALKRTGRRCSPSDFARSLDNKIVEVFEIRRFLG
ncbi:hypothetical protein M0802_004013 [Mischocyttarus mexicanus]|nr:hypothetical protein M0802_004013 [Mischocyttarus mexicanus]